MEIEPLLQKLEVLAPQFGRARDDIAAMAVRGRAGDFKGVMQNARLVLETLLRAMVSTELKQTPGKAMLDELITKFRQQANAGVIPTNILAHMGTVQAWGNLSSHDHAAGLDAEAVKVGQDEVIASLNSMVAILSWYAGRYGSATPHAGSSAVSTATPAPVAPKKSLALPIGAVVGVAVIGAAAWAMTRGSGEQKPAANPPAFGLLDAVYATRHEPIPPEACRSAIEVNLLAPAADSASSLQALQLKSAESKYLLARALFEKKEPAAAALAPALGCAGFAAAQSLAGKIAVSEGRLDEAANSFQLALAASPAFQKARFNLGAVYLKQGKTDDGVQALEQVVKAEPSWPDAQLLLGMGLTAQGKVDLAKEHFCAADKLGETTAHERCVK
ncbi:MAG: tetratricopeptide repeat protein [Myxococcaceae bacterium]